MKYYRFQLRLCSIVFYPAEIHCFFAGGPVFCIRPYIRVGAFFIKADSNIPHPLCQEIKLHIRVLTPDNGVLLYFTFLPVCAIEKTYFQGNTRCPLVIEIIDALPCTCALAGSSHIDTGLNLGP